MLVMCVGFLSSCAANKVPQELANARQAYRQASAGPVAQLAPAELHKAKLALDQAESSFKDDPTSSKTRDLAYVAERKAMNAAALGSIAAQKKSGAEANKDYQEAQEIIVMQTKDELAKSQQEQADAVAAAEAAKHQAQLDSEKRAADLAAVTAADKLAMEQQARRDADMQAADAQAQLARSQQEQADAAAAAAADKLAMEQQARRDAEKRAADAQAELAKVAMVKEEPRGLVITLSGSVVFASNQATLLPEAKSRLNQVAASLMSDDTNRKLIVEGHTDSQGSNAYNMVLSQQRAEAVRSYLISRGYTSYLIEARGIGEERPIADNASPEGRANNRRVEIIVQREEK
jgi:outer membrane protein OmpA-like peptidoglycan-associated protein